VSLLYRPEEDRTGLPGQILLQGAKAKLLDAKLGRISLDQAVQSREF
jgi:hypothetical protein